MQIEGFHTKYFNETIKMMTKIQTEKDFAKQESIDIMQKLIEAHGY